MATGTELTKWRSEKVSEFTKCLMEGIESWIKAGEIVAELLERDPTAVDAICEAIPGLQRDVVYRFESIGRKEVHPRLLLSGTAGIRRLATMPYSLQEQYINMPIEVYIDHDGVVDKMLVKAENLTIDQCKQVFAKNHVRDQAEQRAWLESEKRAVSLVAIEPDNVPYSITGGKITFRRSCVMTRRELKQILKLME